MYIEYQIFRLFVLDLLLKLRTDLISVMVSFYSLVSSSSSAISLSSEMLSFT
jgi:hypothetical protein